MSGVVIGPASPHLAQGVDPGLPWANLGVGMALCTLLALIAVLLLKNSPRWRAKLTVGTNEQKSPGLFWSGLFTTAKASTVPHPMAVEWVSELRLSPLVSLSSVAWGKNVYLLVVNGSNVSVIAEQEKISTDSKLEAEVIDEGQTL